MSEKLIIKNFGPIKSAEIELKRFTVLIGEQATGKSTIAKLLAVCRYFSYITGSHLSFNATKFIPSLGILSGFNQWGIREYMQQGMNIYYSCPDYECEFTTQSSNIDAIVAHLNPVSVDFKELLNQAGEFNGKPLPLRFFENNVSYLMDNPFFLPVERGLQSIFSLGKSSIQNISDSLFNQLAKIDQVSRSFNSEINIEPLGIRYKNESGRGFVKKESENEFHSLNNAASGYQSTIPIVVAVKYYHNIRHKSKTFIIEEPELNLFPVSQSNLIGFLVQESNKIQQNQTHSRFLLTTHSPYILTSLNNLMYAYKVGSEKHEKTNEVIAEANWLNPAEVSCYMLKPDGTAEDILDRESGLIKAEMIDGVSSVLNKEFDELLNIEFAE